MRLLVTGGAGFIGANFVQGAVREHAVTVLDALTYAGSRESLAPVEDDDPAGAGRHHRCRAGVQARRRGRCRRAFAAETHVDNALADPEPFLHAK